MHLGSAGHSIVIAQIPTLIIKDLPLPKVCALDWLRAYGREAFLGILECRGQQAQKIAFCVFLGFTMLGTTEVFPPVIDPQSPPCGRPVAVCATVAENRMIKVVDDSPLLSMSRRSWPKLDTEPRRDFFPERGCTGGALEKRIFKVGF